MNKVIRMTLESASIRAAIRELEQYKNRLREKADQLARRLAEMGAVNVSVDYARAMYIGDKDISVTVEERGDSSYAIVAGGSAVLFVEFGAGVTYGYGHPQAGQFGYGPGTYPSEKGHWNDPRGWWIPGGEHTYGNPPSMTMYNTAKDLRERVEEVAREVFGA